jgi:hypothetical protein
MPKMLAIFSIMLLTVYFPANCQRNGPGSETQSPQTKPDHHVQTDVWVIQAPPKDRYDKASTWIDGLLAVVGMAGIVVAVLTLRKLTEQTEATKNAAKISERTLIAQFRPKVIVRKVRLDPTSFIYYDRRNDGEWRIIMQLANIGGTRATVVSGLGYFQEYRGSSPINDLSPGWTLARPIAIEAGGIEEIEYSLKAEQFRTYMHTLEASTDLRGKQPDRTPIFHGAIVYLDESGIQRETGFGREWNVSEERFIPLGDPTFEYQD